MRTLVFACACMACGSRSPTTGDGDGGGSDAPLPPGTALTDRLTVHDISAPGGVMAGDSSFRIWGGGSLRVSPVVTAPFGCGTLVGYTTGTTSPTAHVAYIDARHQLDTLTSTTDLGPFELRGLAADPDHSQFAALLWDGVQTLHVARFGPGGALSGSTDLTSTLAVPTDFNIGDSRLAFGAGTYSAYYHVHGISGFANGHEGDQLQRVDATTGAASIDVEWGCSHSTSAGLAYSGGDRLAACVTDCFPGTSGDFTTNSIGGVYLDASRNVTDVDGACNGSVAGELGSLAPAASGWMLAWNSHRTPATLGQSSYDPATMNQDVAVAAISPDKTPAAPVFLTDTAGNESNPSIARWQPFGDDREQYVVGWAAPDGTHQLARIDRSGAILEGPVAVTASWGERDDPFRTDTFGDIVWAWFDAPGDTTMHFARLTLGGDHCSTL